MIIFMNSPSRHLSVGPTEWLLAFLRAREKSYRAQSGLAVGPSEWLVVFLNASNNEPPVPQRSTVLSRRYRDDERPVSRLSARSA